MLCPECGASVTADFSSCPWCGTRLHIGAAADLAALSEEAFTTPLFRFPPLTLVLLLINVLLYILMEMHGGSEDQLTLLIFGAKLRAPVLHGAWWRLLTADFLHIGLWHLLLNSLTLIQLGMVCENIYGRSRFLLLYLATGITGFLASTWFGDSLSAGASASLFGLMGATLTFGWRHGPEIPPALRPYFTWYLLPWVVVMIAFGLLYGGIDNWAHLGGLAGGVVFGLLLRNQILPVMRLHSRIPITLALALMASFTTWSAYEAISQGHAMLELLEAAPSEPTGPIEVISRYLDQDGDSGLLYFMRGKAQYEAKRLEASEADMRQALARGYDPPSVKNFIAWISITGTPPSRARLDEAVRLAREAVAADRSPGFLNTLGWALYQRGDYPLAIVQLEAAYHGNSPPSWMPRLMVRLQELVHGQPDPAPILDLYMLAMAYQKQGQPVIARQKFDEADSLEQRLEKPSPETERFRKEAAGLLGVKTS